MMLLRFRGFRLEYLEEFRFSFCFFFLGFLSLGFLPFDVLNIYAFFIFEKKKMKLFFAPCRAA